MQCLSIDKSELMSLAIRLVFVYINLYWVYLYKEVSVFIKQLLSAPVYKIVTD